MKKEEIVSINKSINDRFLFRDILPEEADQAVLIEQICFPPNEACSEKHMKERIVAAPELFLVAVDKETGKIAGFLNGLSTEETVFRDEFFTDITLYDPAGTNVMLLGLDVLPEYRGQGLAREIMHQYKRREQEKGRKALVLTCLDAKVEMYQKFGFQDEGIANSTWGGEEWHEMRFELVHKRRVRYSGTHPKSYKEKYKEHNPEKYADTIEKVLQKGSTPAGMHISIMVQEILDFLQIKPGQTGLDATLGYGGHTKEMLKCLEGQGHIYALDVDPIESAKTKERLAKQGFGEDILTVRLQNFADIDLVTKETGKKFDFVLADLGVSSMQIDNPDRGFSYKVEGPLDLRMNPEKGESAADRLKAVNYEEMVGMLVENADEPYAEEIAKTVMNWRKRGKAIETTTHFKEVIEEALRIVPEKERKEAVKKSCQRSFQALRIDVNSEFEVLYAFLEKLPQVLAPNGRVAILTFHSGEDRLVKSSFKELQRAGIYSEVSKDVIRPSAEECVRNGRAKCTKMRWAIRAEE